MEHGFGSRLVTGRWRSVTSTGRGRSSIFRAIRGLSPGNEDGRPARAGMLDGDPQSVLMSLGRGRSRLDTACAALSTVRHPAARRACQW